LFSYLPNVLLFLDVIWLKNGNSERTLKQQVRFYMRSIRWLITNSILILKNIRNITLTV